MRFNRYIPLSGWIGANVGYSLFLLALLLVAAVGWAASLNSAQAQSANGVYDTDGDGLIEVSNLAQLDAIRYDPLGTGSPSPDNRAAYYGAFPGAVAGMGCPNGDCYGYELVADLDFDTNGSGQADAGDAYWNDGAGWEPIGYHRTFDGNDHTIANLFINRTNEDNVGLFGSVGTIRNIGLLAANVTGVNQVGGLVGSGFGGNISNSYATGTVTGRGNNVGGLVGLIIGDSNISDSYATGTVTGSRGVGGLVGSLSRGSGSIRVNISISDSYATGTVTGSEGVGGLVGSLSGGYIISGVRVSINISISDSYATGTVTGSEGVGGLVGYVRGIVVSSSYATGAVTGSGNNVGGLVGSGFGGNITSDSYATGAVTGVNQVGGLVGYGGNISNSYATGAVTGVNQVGGLVGYGGNIRSSYATGAVTGSGDNVGGLVGKSGGYIRSSYATGAVTGSGDVGGLVGKSGGYIISSYATGAVTGIRDGVGGLVGESGRSISDSYATGTVTGGNRVGGLVGYGSGVNISIISSYATGAVTGSGDNVAGLVGALSDGYDIISSYATGAVTGSGDNVGGLVGSLESLRGGRIYIRSSYATGTVTGSGDNVGGLVGYGSGGNISISSSYATGAVTGEFDVGGLVGHSGGNISTSYATGHVSGTGAIGGLVGSSTRTTTDSYWDTETSGQLYSDGGSGKTTAELQSPTGYTGIYAAWDSTEVGDVWDFGDSSQYPALKADLGGDGTATAWEFGGQGRTAPPMPPGTATISSVTPGPGSLTVSWRAPSGDVSRITAYDLRHIRVGADQAAEANWTVVDNAWTGSGLLQYVLTGLTNGTQYGVQVRAVNSIGDGPWSGTATGTPQPPGASSVSRSFSAASVEPRGQLTVTITGAGTGAAQVVETLPMGFSYVSSSLPDSSVALAGQVITFTIRENDSFTYTVTASSVAGVYPFTGTLRSLGDEIPIGGDSTVTVGSVPMVGVPMVELSLDGSPPSMIRTGSPVPVTATFSKAVSGFTVDDVTVANGTVSNFVAAAGGMVYTFDVTPSDIARVTVDIAADVAMDADGNGNTAAPQLSFTPYDDDGVPGISRAEVIAAIQDYFSGKLTRAQAIAVIQRYFASRS